MSDIDGDFNNLDQEDPVEEVNQPLPPSNKPESKKSSPDRG